MSNNEAFYYNKPVLVTGGAGFIGSYIVERLIALGAQVTILDNLSTGTLSYLSQVNNNFTFIQGSITDYTTCLRATEKQQIIFHCAALVSIPQSIENKILCHTTNVTGTLFLLEAARHNKVKTFIFSSSSAVYGITSTLCHEEMTCKPLSPYGYSKLLGEYYCQQYAQLYGLKTLSLRYFNVYSPRQKITALSYANFYTQALYKLRHNEPLTIYGDGNQTRDFVPLEKIGETNILLAQLPDNLLNGQKINVAQGTSISLLELFEHLKKDFPHYNHSPVFAPARPGDITHSRADCTTLYMFLQLAENSLIAQLTPAQKILSTSFSSTEFL